MSAWDIAGAVVWTLVFAFCAYGFCYAADHNIELVDKDGVSICVLLFLPSLAGAVFCIARLFGAHA